MSLGIARRHAKQAVASAKKKLGLPSTPGLARRVFRAVIQSPPAVSTRRAVRRHKKVVCISVASLVVIAGAWIAYEHTRYHITPEERDFMVEVKALLARGESSRGPKDDPWLVQAASQHFVAAVRFLLDEGEEVNAAKPSGWTALHAARNAKICELLLEHGADPNRRDKAGRTSLHTRKEADAAELLIQHGADVNAKDAKGRTPLDACWSVSDIERAFVLLTNGGRAGTEQAVALLACAAEKDQYQILIEALLKAGANPNGEYNDLLPLHRAIVGNAEHNVTLLLDHGADPNTKFHDETYAGNWLDVAGVQFKRPGTVSDEDLTEKHNLVNLGGMTPLDAAKRIGADKAAMALRNHNHGP